MTTGEGRPPRLEGEAERSDKKVKGRKGWDTPLNKDEQKAVTADLERARDAILEALGNLKDRNGVAKMVKRAKNALKGAGVHGIQKGVHNNGYVPDNAEFLWWHKVEKDKIGHNHALVAWLEHEGQGIYYCWRCQKRYKLSGI